MRVMLALCCLFLAGCSGSKEPLPSEYVQFHYRLTPGGGTGEEPLVLPIEPGSLRCGRREREIRITARRGVAKVELVLHDAATMPAELQASTITAGKVNLEVIVPESPDMGGPVGFLTSDPGDVFTCRIRVAGPDPFKDFRARFSCISKPTVPRQLTLMDGEVRAVPCQ